MDSYYVVWGWAIVCAVFILVELFTSTFFGLWMAIAAIVPAFIAFFLPDVSLVWQIGIWIVSMIVCSFVWVKVSKKTYPDQTIEDSIVGQIGILSRGCSRETCGVLILQKPVEGLTEWKCFSDEELKTSTRVVVSQKVNPGVVHVTPSKTSFL
ncbi:NfeD family protein (plasmid) [Providencia huaxiensis]|uniref:NfeD family protein n=5 Tax=Enterobacterales TaxID=91347 RepID=Q8L2A7_PROVU|nr:MULTISPECIES: hypothetical protein [Enterobacterales]ELB1214752.1 hypothetical protein [Proteus mirabilis]ELY4881577.1 hypothetical protein [Morganella morganii]HAZ7869401.1 hypothetical protein [Escherichia coli]ELR5094379.1 hypothetical protein [Providencia rettgeri]ELR5243228.1 hypothetical protein [Providencia rettgeri]